VIEEANWLSLPDDLEGMLEGGFDALICLGNSFAHLVDVSGDQSKQRLAISNFEFCIRPGGLLIIDHRNFDAMMDNSPLPRESIYYRVRKFDLELSKAPLLKRHLFCIRLKLKKVRDGA